MVKWDLGDIYSSLDAKSLEKIFLDLSKKVYSFERNRTKLNNKISGKEIYKLISKLEEISLIESKLGSYVGLKVSENTSDAKSQALSSKVEQFLTDISNKLMFFSLWWKDVDEKNAKRILKDLGKHSAMMKRARRFNKYTLSESEEKIMNIKDSTGVSAVVNIYEIITNAYTYDFNGKKDVSREEVSMQVKSPNPKIREKAYETLLGRYGEEENVLGEIYRSIVLDWVNEGIKLRNYKSPISVRNLGNNIPDEAIDALLNVCKKNVKVLQDYFKLKAKILGMKKLRRYDLYAPLKNVSKDYKFDEAKKIVLDVFNDFDPEFYEMAKRMFDTKHVHSDIKKGKRGGAFCSSVAPSIDPYVLLNFVGKYNDVTTMAHELGHAIHDMHAKDKTIFDFHSPLPLAETASIFSEMLLEEKLLKDGMPKNEKIHMLTTQLDGIYASIIRQSYFVMFEEKAHEMIQNGCTVHDLNKEWVRNLKEQFGNSVEVNDVFQHEWKYIPHIYHTPFYCYAYAFGNLLVLALFNMYKKEGKSFVPKYKKILSYGGSKAPAEVLKEVGIDISKEEFWQSGFDLIKDLVKNLKKELNS
ncbi:M3 family oligoendopeptidase [Candidatus Woesearchaeota archaeon]|jgi:oligoendopeptidase F|nr:M3 family oligoendopeptidase [Candidatus Woesearchaeota archaeon]